MSGVSIGMTWTGMGMGMGNSGSIGDSKIW
jgi:hypothetical protein